MRYRLVNAASLLWAVFNVLLIWNVLRPWLLELVAPS